MRLKYQLETMEIEDDIVAVPVGNGAEEVHGVFKLNKEGAEILKLLEKETTENAIVEYLKEKYENDPKSIKELVNKFIEDLQEYELII